MKHVVVLHSGGMDSTVCLLQAIELELKVTSLGIAYGQRHSIELEYAERLCRQYGVERRVVGVQWDKPIRNIPLDRDVREMPKSISPAFLPGRNLVFLSLACAEAAGLGAAEVWIGVNEVDFSGYPDCTSSFIDAFSNTVRIGIGEVPRLVTPLIALSKPEIARLAAHYGLSKDSTWSCYRPLDTPDGPTACGHCDACRLHNHAWAQVQAQEREP